MRTIVILTGDDIRNMRESAGMNQRELGEILGVADATVNRWEFGKRRPNYEMMERLNALAEKHLKLVKKKKGVT